MKSQLDQRPGLLDVRQAARLLGIQVSTLYAWTEQQRIPHVRLGRALRFDLRVLEQWVQQNSIAPRNR